ncbi:MAG: GNAT family N-acetyltransferase [Rhodospirillales bacterium]
MRFTQKEFSREEWADIVSKFADLSLLQCWEYGAAKSVDGWRAERGLIIDGGKTLGAAQVMIRNLPIVGGGLAWVSRGPLWRPHGEAGSAMLFGSIHAALRRHYVDELGYYLRMAPAVEESKAASASLTSCGFTVSETPGWASAVLDLTQGDGALRQELRPNWRNKLNKAERHDIRVEQGSDWKIFDGLVDEYRTFMAGRGFTTTVTPAFLSALQAGFSEGRRMKCFRASHEGAPLGSVLIAYYGDTAEYLIGTLLDAGRAFNVGQLLVWQAIRDCRESGVMRFDVSGMDPELTPKGVYDFKQGLGGRPYRLMNEVEAHDGGWRSRLVRWRVARMRRAGEKAGSDRQ